MSRRDFNSGVEAGAKPFEEKFNRMSDDFMNAANNINSKVDDLNKATDFIIDELNSLEKKRLYDLNIVADIGELGDDEKELLMAILYTLANMSEEVTQHQQDYLRSAKAYLQVKNVQNNVDLAVIENIENINDQKAILQSIMEFLFIENADHNYMEEYEDVIDYFSVNKKGIKEIQECINTVYKATGLKGLAEMYGYEPEENSSDAQKSDEEFEFLGYAGEDISSACADKVNINEEYISVGKYVIFKNKKNEDDKKYCRVDKTNGEMKDFNFNGEFYYAKLCGVNEQHFLIYNAHEDDYKISLYDVETLKYENIDVVGNPERKLYSYNEKIYYYTSTNEEKGIIVEHDIKSKTNKVLEKTRPKGEYDYLFNERNMVLGGNKLYFKVDTDEFSDKNNFEYLLIEYNCLTGAYKKLCSLDEHRDFLDYGSFTTSGVFKNYIYSIIKDLAGDQLYLKYLDLKKQTQIRTEKIPVENVSFINIYGEWLYYAVQSWEKKIYKYNMFTGENICLMEKSDMVYTLKEKKGLLKKTIVETYNIAGLRTNLIGNWLYYRGWGFPKKPIKKVEIESGAIIPFSI